LCTFASGHKIVVDLHIEDLLKKKKNEQKGFVLIPFDEYAIF
jgi:hypothetical protein